MKQLITNSVFIKLTISSILQSAGVWIRNMTLLFFVMDLTGGNPLAVSMLTVVQYAPIFIFSIVGGVLADRWRPKATMIYGELFSFLSILLIMAGIRMGYWQAVFVTGAISSIVSQFSQPSAAIIIKQHVPEKLISTVMAVSQTQKSLFLIGGPALGTVVFNRFGLEASIGSLLILFLLSALCLSFLPKSVHEERRDRSSFSSEFTEGFRYLQKNRHLGFFLIIFALVALGEGLLKPVEIFLVRDRLQLPVENVQWLTGSMGLGMLSGGICAGIFVRSISGNKGVIYSLFLLGGLTMIEVWSIWPWLTGFVRFLMGIAIALVQTFLSSFMLTAVEGAYIGRMNGMISPVFTGSLLIGSSISGMFLNATSLFVVYVTASFIFLIAAFFSFNIQSIKER
ncbi:MFS transporter [Paenibacillus piri]|uniref:MFS transporter n=1 Tax=Paenibacillus piri TaxID=2547395 RepID=A0A4R5K947_9BACL|nr:MFS transporter [Paenibacillus piri]TDF91342.1 MFS transporter [Paenibacillus piri]